MTQMSDESEQSPSNAAAFSRWHQLFGVGVVVLLNWFTSTSLTLLNKHLLTDFSLWSQLPFIITWFQCAFAALLYIGYTLWHLYSSSRRCRNDEYTETRATSWRWEHFSHISFASVCFVAKISLNNISLKHVSTPFYFNKFALSIVFNIVCAFSALTAIFLKKRLSKCSIVCCTIVIAGYMLNSWQETKLGTPSIASAGLVVAALVSLLFAVQTKRCLEAMTTTTSTCPSSISNTTAAAHASKRRQNVSTVNANEGVEIHASPATTLDDDANVRRRVKHAVWQLASVFGCALLPVLAAVHGEFSVLFRQKHATNQTTIMFQNSSANGVDESAGFGVLFWPLMFVASLLGILLGCSKVWEIDVTSPLSHAISGCAKSAVLPMGQIVATFLYTNKSKPSLAWWVYNAIVMSGAVGYTLAGTRDFIAQQQKMTKKDPD